MYSLYVYICVYVYVVWIAAALQSQTASRNSSARTLQVPQSHLPICNRVPWYTCVSISVSFYISCFRLFLPALSFIFICLFFLLVSPFLSSSIFLCLCLLFIQAHMLQRVSMSGRVPHVLRFIQRATHSFNRFLALVSFLASCSGHHDSMIACCSGYDSRPAQLVVTGWRLLRHPYTWKLVIQNVHTFARLSLQGTTKNKANMRRRHREAESEKETHEPQLIQSLS